MEVGKEPPTVQRGMNESNEVWRAPSRIGPDPWSDNLAVSVSRLENKSKEALFRGPRYVLQSDNAAN